MKTFILYNIILFGLISCRSESYKITEQQKEIERLKQVISDQKEKETKLEKLLFRKKPDTGGVILSGLNYFYLINRPVSKNISLKKEYETDVIFTTYVNPAESAKFYYAVPSKERKLDRKCNNVNNYNLDAGGYKLKFVPKDTGMYYWNGALVILNNYTGEAILYPVVDSFYVHR